MWHRCGHSAHRAHLRGPCPCHRRGRRRPPWLPRRAGAGRSPRPGHPLHRRRSPSYLRFACGSPSCNWHSRTERITFSYETETPMPDAVIVSALRTPIGTAMKGTLRDTDAYQLAEHIVGTAVADLGSAQIDDVILGEGLYGGGVV